MIPLELRLDRLERQNRKLRGLLLTLALALLALLGWGAAAPAPERLQARQIEIVDETGRAVAVLGADEMGGWLRLYTLQGAERMRLAATAVGSELEMNSASDRPLISLNAGFMAGMLRVDAGMLKVGSKNLGSTVILARTVREGE